MKTIVKTVEIAAPPAAIWRRLAAMDWESWDADLRRLEAINGGLVEGGTCRMAMRNGLTIAARFGQIRPPHHAAYWCTHYGGLLKAHGRFEIEPTAHGARVAYHFGMGGPFGAVMMRTMAGRVDDAVQHCADGLKRVVEAEYQRAPEAA